MTSVKIAALALMSLVSETQLASAPDAFDPLDPNDLFALCASWQENGYPSGIKEMRCLADFPTLASNV